MVLRNIARTGYTLESYKFKIASVTSMIVGIVCFIIFGILMIMKQYLGAGVVFVVGILAFLSSWYNRWAGRRASEWARRI